MNGQPPQAKRPPEPKDARGFQRWAVLLTAAALIGGLAAAALSHESVVWAVVFSLIVAAAALIALAGGLLDDDADTPHRQPPKRRRPSRHSADHPVPPQPDPVAPPPSRPDRPGSTVVAPAATPGGAVLDVDLAEPPEPASGNRPWWDRPEAPPAMRPAAALPADDRVPQHVRLAAPGVTESGGQAQIAQCPQCGSFRVGAGTQATPPWHFACHECGRAWNWRPGMPWPSVQVRPNARSSAEKPGW
jgi:hypothetical protein